MPAAALSVLLLAGCALSGEGGANPSASIGPTGPAQPSAQALGELHCFGTGAPPPCERHWSASLSGRITLDPVSAEFSLTTVMPIDAPAESGDSDSSHLAVPVGLEAEVYGADGELLDTHDVDPQWTGPEVDATEVSGRFDLALPSREGVTRVALVHDGAVIGERTAGPAAPTVANVRATEADGAMELEWDAADADQDALTYAVTLLYANGERRSVALDTDQATLTLESELLEGGAGTVAQVVATDGLNVGWGFSVPFDLEDQAPMILLDAAASPVTADRVSSTVLTADAYDTEDGDLGDALSWESDIDGMLVTGRELYVNGGTVIGGPALSDGRHTVTLTVEDSAGNIATDSFELHLRE